MRRRTAIANRRVALHVSSCLCLHGSAAAPTALPICSTPISPMTTMHADTTVTMHYSDARAYHRRPVGHESSHLTHAAGAKLARGVNRRLQLRPAAADEFLEPWQRRIDLELAHRLDGGRPQRGVRIIERRQQALD